MTPPRVLTRRFAATVIRNDGPHPVDAELEYSPGECPLAVHLTVIWEDNTTTSWEFARSIITSALNPDVAAHGYWCGSGGIRVAVRDRCACIRIRPDAAHVWLSASDLVEFHNDTVDMVVPGSIHEAALTSAGMAGALALILGGAR